MNCLQLSNKSETAVNQQSEHRYKQIQNKWSTQTRLAPYPNPNYVWTHQLCYDVRIQLDSVMEEPESTISLVWKFKQIFTKTTEEESSAILYPYSTTSSAVPIMDKLWLPNTYSELRRYVPGLKPPMKDFNLAYRQLYIGTNT